MECQCAAEGEITVEKPDKNGIVRVCTDLRVIYFRIDQEGNLHYANMAFTYLHGDKTENTELLEEDLSQKVIDFVRREAEKQIGCFQPRLL